MNHLASRPLTTTCHRRPGTGPVALLVIMSTGIASRVLRIQFYVAVSILVSFTPVRGGSPVNTRRLSALVRTLTAGAGRWYAVLESV